MKDAAHHLKQVQRKIIQKARRDERIELNKLSGMPLKDLDENEVIKNPKMHNFPNYH
jgi:hypothetical protein